MRALFVTNQRKTAFYSAIAKRMRDLGAEIFWISTALRWTNDLIADGWPRASILPLADFGQEWSGGFEPREDDFARARRIEAGSATTIKNILIMDRELNKLRGARAEAYGFVALREIDKFVAANRIEFGFGEPTWAPEQLTAEVLRARGGAYFMHHTIRIPSERVAFFEGIFHDRIAKLCDPDASHRAIARAAIQDVRERGQRPYYFASNKNPQRFRRYWLEEAKIALLQRDAGRYDHTVPALFARGARRLVLRAQAAAAGRQKLFEPAPGQAAERRYILAPLHQQPEASVDVFGGAMNNQLEVIRALTRILPADREIYVKEHSHAIGSRSGRAYAELAALPGVRLIDPNADTMALIRGAELVLSVASTACLEAAVMGVPAATFGRLAWKPILLRSGLDPFGMTPGDMLELLNAAERLRADPGRDQRIEDFMTWLVAQSFEGLISDPASDPACIAPDNVDRVAEATVRVMTQRMRDNAKA